MRLIFMGTPDFAATALSALIAAGHEICAVYSQPPRPAKRGQKPQKSAVHRLADTKGLEVRTPKTFKDDQVRADFAALNVDAAVVAAYGLLLPVAALNAPTHGCLNIHASLLPRWRGAAPIHRAIEAGDTETGISIMQMERGLDTGPILLTHALDIDPLDTTGTLHDKLATLGGDAIVEALEDLAAMEPLVPTPQPAAGVTYAAKIDKAETPINWSDAPAVIARKIRAFSPFPGAWFSVEGERIKVLNARVSPTGGSSTTDALSSISELTIGGVELLELQRSGKTPQTAQEFVRGFKNTAALNQIELQFARTDS